MKYHLIARIGKIKELTLKGTRMNKIFLLILGLSISLLAYNGGTYKGNIKGCAKGNAKACNDLAGMYLSGRSHPVRVLEDKEKAVFYYAKSRKLYSQYCDEGDGKACFDLAEIYNGMKWNVDQNYTIMLKHFTKSCENDYARGCNEVGAFYKRGRGTKIDKIKSQSYYTKAVALYEEECDKGTALSCSNLSAIYILEMYGTHNTTKGLELKKRAFDLYKELCENKDDEGCFQMARHYYNGTMVPIDWKKAKEYYELSCEYGQSSACWRARDINISKQFEHEQWIEQRKLISKYIMMEEKERKIRNDRITRQKKELNDPIKTEAEKNIYYKKIKTENIIWNKEYEKRIKAIKKAQKDEIEKIQARTK